MTMDEPASPFPPADLGDFGAVAFSPGRFASLVQRTVFRTDRLRVVRDDLTSSFVLELLADGSARACRGWRYLSTVDGPEVHRTEHLREQLGYEGRWTPEDGWTRLEVHRVDAACPRIAEYTELVPHHAEEWRLRCVALAPAAGTPRLPEILLACEPAWPHPLFGEDEPHLVPGLVPGRWILLGSGHGLRVRSRAQQEGSGPAEPEVEIEAAPDRVEADSWTRSF